MVIDYYEKILSLRSLYFAGAYHRARHTKDYDDAFSLTGAASGSLDGWVRQAFL